MTVARFYHVPKTGGTALFNMTEFWPNHRRSSSNHVRIREDPPKSDETIVYAVIRDPYDRFVSAFYHVVDACNDDFFYKNAQVSDCDWLRESGISGTMFSNDPNVFAAALDNRNHPLFAKARELFYKLSIFRSQIHWLGDWSGSLHKSIRLLRSETLKQDFAPIASQLGHDDLRWPEGKSANNRITKAAVPLNPVSRAVVRRLYSSDFDALPFS